VIESLAIKAMIVGPRRQYLVGSIDGPALELTKITKAEKLFHRPSTSYRRPPGSRKLILTTETGRLR
jgi:hypothetical protein